jgi:ATP-binding cassette subfamily C (CFTR/MRP) protein 1
LLIRILNFLNDPNVYFVEGLIYVFILFMLNIISLFTNHHHFLMTINISLVKVKSALVSILYRKLLKLSNESKQKQSSGEIINLMSIDSFKIANIIQFL